MKISNRFTTFWIESPNRIHRLWKYYQNTHFNLTWMNLKRTHPALAVVVMVFHFFFPLEAIKENAHQLVMSILFAFHFICFGFCSFFRFLYLNHVIIYIFITFLLFISRYFTFVRLTRLRWTFNFVIDCKQKKMQNTFDGSFIPWNAKEMQTHHSQSTEVYSAYIAFFIPQDSKWQFPFAQVFLFENQISHGISLIWKKNDFDLRRRTNKTRIQIQFAVVNFRVWNQSER